MGLSLVSYFTEDNVHLFLLRKKSVALSFSIKNLLQNMISLKEIRVQRLFLLEKLKMYTPLILEWFR